MRPRGRLLRLPLGLLLALTGHAQGARAAGDRVGAMAEQLLSGRRVLDYEAALETFARRNDPRVLPTLLKLVDKGPSEARAEAAGVLWRYDSKDVRERLSELTKDADPHVRIEAAKALCLMRYPASLPVITEELGAGNPSVRARALRALGAVGGDEAIKALKDWKPTTPADRTWAAYGLARAGADRPAQLALLERELMALPKAALLIGLSDPGEDDLARASQAGQAGLDARLGAAEALARLGDEAALRALVAGLADRAAARSPSGARRLLLKHPEGAALECARALGSAPVLVRLGCAQLAQELARQGDTAREKLAEALGVAVEDGSRLTRQAALRALAMQGMTSQAPRVARALARPDESTRREAALALGRMRDERYTDSLLKRLEEEKAAPVRRAVYQGLAALGSARSVAPLWERLRSLAERARQDAAAAAELPLAIRALAATGEPAADRTLKALPRVSPAKRDVLLEVLARTGTENALNYFLDALREAAPEPDGPAVRFFDSLDKEFVPRLKQLIESETAMWLRLILARALYRLGETEFGRGILWGLRHDEVVMRRLAAALARDLKVPGSVEPLVKLLVDEPRAAWFAARALMTFDSPKAMEGLIRNLDAPSLRGLSPLPLLPYWEGSASAKNPFVKEVDNDRVWVLFAEDRMGRPFDLFLTWSVDGRTWNAPVFTGLTSFADREGQVPPPTFSFKARGRELTIAHTRTFVASGDPARPKFKTLQRVHKHKLQDLFKDKDEDGLPDLTEAALFTSPTRPDTDGDGLLDGQDKNPLARPAAVERDEEVLQVLAFTYAHLVRELLSDQRRLLLVEELPGKRRPPELPTFEGLVLHLKPEQLREHWAQTGVAHPRVRFGSLEYESGKQVAVQALTLAEGLRDERTVEVRFIRRDGAWMVQGYREVD